MSSECITAAARAVAVRSRRAVFGALLATIIAPAAAVTFPVRRGRKKNKKKDRDKDKRKKKGSKSTHGDCTVRHSEQEILDFIKKAAKEYGQSEHVMVRVARCESTLNPCAFNSSGPWYGLYQYLKSTWKTTPYGDRSIWDPEAQALATGWMWKQGRKNEWTCQ
jgi:Transglycosylase SLT domain